MSEERYEKKVVGKLRDVGPQTIDLDVQNAFCQDLAKIIEMAGNLENGLPKGILWAPYIDPLLSDIIMPLVAFPNSEITTFAFLVRPLDQMGKATEQFYGVPIFVHDKVPLQESGLLERRVESFRFGNDINPDSDALVGILRKKHDGRIERANQDLLVSITLGELLSAYKEEGCAALDSGVDVQRVKIIVPTNPKYTTEAAGFVAHAEPLGIDMVCFAYGIGDRFYRGRPILGGDLTRGPRIVDIDEHGKNCYFNIEALSKVKDRAGSYASGNFVVIALPLEGEGIKEQLRADSGILRDSAMKSLETLTCGPTRGIDAAAFSTGRRTGTRERLVNLPYDNKRVVGIIDAQVYVLTPENFPNFVNQLNN